MVTAYKMVRRRGRGSQTKREGKKVLLWLWTTLFIATPFPPIPSQLTLWSDSPILFSLPPSPTPFDQNPGFPLYKLRPLLCPATMTFQCPTGVREL